MHNIFIKYLLISQTKFNLVISLSFYVVNVSLSTLRIINIFNNTIQNIEDNIIYKNLIFTYSYS
jgi:hypothetical protein